MTSTPRNHAKVATVLATALALVCAGSAAGDDTGGAAFSPPPSSQVGDAGLHGPATALFGGSVVFSGTTAPGTTVDVQRLDSVHGWQTAVTAQADGTGAYTASWRANRAGVVPIRAVPASNAQARASSTTAPIRVTVFRRSKATWFGPGFYGHRTACGEKMTKTLVGVANRTLPCGTKVALLYKGRTVTVPVVDRGPYGDGASWDLTAAAARELGFRYTDTLGAVALGGRA